MPEELKGFLTILKTAGIKSIIAFGLFIVLWNSFYTTEAGEYVSERPPSGEIQAVMNPGVHFKVPFVTTIEYWDQFHTVIYSGDNKQQVNFADTYSGKVGGSLRFELSADPEKFIETVVAFKTNKNLIKSGYNLVGKQLLTYTANQITGENFMQGGQNNYQNRIEDQGNLGMYITKREKILVKKQRSNVGLKDQNPTDRKQRDSYIYITKIQMDKNGGKMRKPLAIAEYGITLSQVTIDDFDPESKLQTFIDNKKTQIAIRQKLIEEQENERQSAITAELKGTRQRVEAKQEQLKQKDAEVIKAQKRVELEQKESDLQVVRKNKELEIATANEGIQKANAVAARYQASAIEATGLAKAKVKKAMYSAVRKDILQLETDKSIAEYKYAALPNVKIAMPTNVMISGSDKSIQLDSLTNTMIIDALK